MNTTQRRNDATTQANFLAARPLAYGGAPAAVAKGTVKVTEDAVCSALCAVRCALRSASTRNAFAVARKQKQKVADGASARNM